MKKKDITKQRILEHPLDNEYGVSSRIGRYDPVLTIGTVANEAGVAVQTIRLYEEERLILPFKTKTGRRMYSLSDLDRILCIRKMLTEHGLNISGIKKLLSLVPCWEFKGGLDSDCKNCPAYYDAQGPCWSMKSEVGIKCQVEDCRSCPAYRIELNCEKLKEVVFGHKRPEIDTNQSKNDIKI